MVDEKTITTTKGWVQEKRAGLFKGLPQRTGRDTWRGERNALLLHGIFPHVWPSRNSPKVS